MTASMLAFLVAFLARRRRDGVDGRPIFRCFDPCLVVGNISLVVGIVEWNATRCKDTQSGWC